MSVSYVTAFLDLQRESWISFSRTFDAYLAAFTPFLSLFTGSDSRFIVFIDKRHIHTVQRLVNGTPNILLVEISEPFLETHSVLWRRLPRELEIIQSEDEYRRWTVHRQRYPENTNPRYTLINHCKIDFVNLAMEKDIHSEYFCWVDFGYFSKPENIPTALLDIEKLDKEKINYTLVSPVIPEEDRDYIYTLQVAPERIGGFFFFGSRKSMISYQKLYHKVHSKFQTLGIVDDDQHIALQCYFVEPSLFALHYVGGWHKALIAFQTSACASHR